jgi:hypothetical protein
VSPFDENLGKRSIAEKGRVDVRKIFYLESSARLYHSIVFPQEL